MHFLTHQRFECTSHTYIDAQGNINLIAMKVSAKSLLIVTVICSLVVSSIPSMTPAAAEATISTEDDDEVSTPNIWCVDNSQGSDWTNGSLTRGKALYGWISVRSCPCQLRSSKRIYCWLGTCRLYISKINPFYFLLFMNHQSSRMHSDWYSQTQAIKP